MKLSQFINLRAEDYPGFKEGPRLFSVLNPLFVQLRQIFDGNVEFESNIKSILKSFNSTGVTLPVTFAWPYPLVTPQILQITQATVNGTPAILLPAWSYDSSTYQISITSLVQITTSGTFGVSSSSVYKFNVRVSV